MRRREARPDSPDLLRHLGKWSDLGMAEWDLWDFGYGEVANKFDEYKTLSLPLKKKKNLKIWAKNRPPSILGLSLGPHLPQPRTGSALLKPAEKYFLEKFVTNYEKQVPKLYDFYQGKVGVEEL